MFTGIIEEIGKVERIQKDTCNCKLSIKASKILEDIHLGDSIAVNGICLTVTCFTRQSFTVDVMNETWNRTALSLLRHGSLVNLERAMPMNGRLGGHIVTGHIDGTGRISSVRRDKNAVWYQINTQRELLKKVRLLLTVLVLLSQKYRKQIFRYPLSLILWSKQFSRINKSGIW